MVVTQAGVGKRERRRLERHSPRTQNVTNGIVVVILPAEGPPMTRIHGEIYSPESDEEIAGEGEDGYRLLQTPTGAFYLSRNKQQLFEHGEWRDVRDGEDFCATLKLQFPDDFPSPRVRNLAAARPFSQEEAYVWCVENFMPECFRARAPQNI